MWWFFSWPVSILTWAWRSYVAVTLWRWFAEPIGGAHVSVVRAMGIGLVVRLATMHVSSADMEADARLKVKYGDTNYHFICMALGFLGPLFVLGFGWLYSQWL